MTWLRRHHPEVNSRVFRGLDSRAWSPLLITYHQVPISIQKDASRRDSGFSKAPNPEIQFWGSNLLSPKGSKNTSSWGQRVSPGLCPPVVTTAPKLAVLLARSARILQTHPRPTLLCQDLGYHPPGWPCPHQAQEWVQELRAGRQGDGLRESEAHHSARRGQRNLRA